MPTGRRWSSSFRRCRTRSPWRGAAGSTLRFRLPTTSGPGRRRPPSTAPATAWDHVRWWCWSRRSRKGRSDNLDGEEEDLMKHGKLMVVAGMIGLLCGDSGAAAVYETQTNKPVKSAIAASLAAGPDYKVNDPIVADGYMYRFRVTSTYGPFQATGIGALQKLEHEIWAIGQLKNVTRSEAFLKAAVDQAGKPLVFVKDVVTKPAETLAGIPKGVSRLFSNVATSVSTPRKPSQESRAKEALQVGAFKRDYATRYGVDPYSTNQPRWACGRRRRPRSPSRVRPARCSPARVWPSRSTTSWPPSHPRASATSTRRSSSRCACPTRWPSGFWTVQPIPRARAFSS